MAPVAASATGAAILAALLRLRPALARHAADSLCALPPALLAALCGDPNASRHVLEPLVEAPPAECSAATRALGRLRERHSVR